MGPVLELHPKTTDQALAFVSLGLRALSERAYQWATLVLVSAAWGLTLFVAEPTPLRLTGCVIFTVLVHVHTYWKETAHVRAARPQAPDA